MPHSYSHKDYDAEKYLNNDRFIGVRINDTTFIATEFNPDERKNTLRISDISPDDYCALIIADDTTLLECYIRSLDNDDEGKTRLALYDFHKPLLTACYSDDGKWIAVMATDTTYYLFDEKQGEYHEELEDSARYFITRNEQRKFLYLRTGGTNEINLRDGTIIDKRYVKSTIRLPEYNKKNDIHSQLYVSTNEDEINDKNTYYNIATMSFEIDRTLMDSLLYSDSVDVQKLLKTENHYSWDYYCYIIKYYQMHPELFTPSFPVINCFSPDSKRFFFSVRSEVYGFYVGVNCLSYFKSFDDLEIHTLHMTNDNQWLVINAGEDTQKILYMKPLPELIEDCKALFFKWEMPIDERFEAYKQLN